MKFNLTEISTDMPDFENHDQAREWFKEQFHDCFSLKSTDETGGKKVYYYHIIKDVEAYQQYMDSFGRLGEHEITNPETFESYSTVEISEDGEISLSI
ncbi:MULTISPECIES: hypothetical protein [Bacillaceae]|uniref:Uncharacterized protein n=1 Tax=Evansella alkalicola TaxID=745819 RepID=A0ABS6JR50_9BACI|nr:MULTISPECIES: hypothetical protein [Bacillaceae]MBU9720895.1 hypothetical protein [Bacillus alkalicola]